MIRPRELAIMEVDPSTEINWGNMVLTYFELRFVDNWDHFMSRRHMDKCNANKIIYMGRNMQII